jgi:hypothetical protein
VALCTTRFGYENVFTVLWAAVVRTQRLSGIPPK